MRFFLFKKKTKKTPYLTKLRPRFIVNTRTILILSKNLYQISNLLFINNILLFYLSLLVNERFN